MTEPLTPPGKNGKLLNGGLSGDMTLEEKNASPKGQLRKSRDLKDMDLDIKVGKMVLEC